MKFVLDCSVVMAWCFDDESDGYADKVLNLVTKNEALVPSLWPLEVANVLLVGERKKRLTKADSARFIELLSAQPISVDPETPEKAFGDTLALARDCGLSAYDASYLELAMRHGIPLATGDQSLRKAAEKSGIRLLKV